jgi:ABC-type transport system involved in cytochrome c biogenesis permease component
VKSTEPAAAGPTLMQTRIRQLVTIVRREATAQLLRWRGAWIYALALAPLVIVTVHALRDPADSHRLSQETTVVAGIVHFYYLRVAVFFGAAALFSRAFRGEMVERTLHYSLLAPVRREVLVLGKFLGNLLVSLVVFVTGVAAVFLAMYGHFPEGVVFLREGAGAAQLGAYVLATALACVGYGAIFLVLGLVFRNIGVPAVTLLGLETWSGALPPLLQRLTVTYYLKPICPVPPQLEGFAALLTVAVEPTPTWLAVVGLVLFAAAVLAFASVKVRRMEINYTTD